MKDNMRTLTELIKDENNAKELLSIGQPQDAQKWLSDHGAEFTLNEINTLGSFFSKVSAGEITEDTDVKAVLNEQPDEELSDDELAMASGGSDYSYQDFLNDISTMWDNVEKGYDSLSKGQVAGCGVAAGLTITAIIFMW